MVGGWRWLFYKGLITFIRYLKTISGPQMVKHRRSINRGRKRSRKKKKTNLKIRVSLVASQSVGGWRWKMSWSLLRSKSEMQT